MTKKTVTLLASLTCGLVLAAALLQILSAPAPITYAQPAIDQTMPALTLPAPVHNSPAMPTITTTVVAGNAGPHSDLTIDHQGRPHVSYNDAGSGLIYHAVFSDGHWLTDTIDSNALLRGNAIAFDQASGQPVVAYERDYDLVYAYLDNGAWLTDTLVAGSSGVQHRHMDIAVGDQGQSQIAFSQDRWTSGYWFSDLRHARQTEGSWSFETVDSEGEAIHPPVAMALDSQNNPAILYKKQFFGGYFGVRLQQWLSPTWQLSVLRHGWYNTFPVGAGLAVDDNDQPWSTYMWRGQWLSAPGQADEQLSTSGMVYMSSLALDESGQPHIVIRQGDSLLLISKSSCGWFHTPLATVTSGQESDVSLAISDDIAHVIYYDAASEQLIHLRQPLALLQPGLDILPPEPGLLPADGQSTAVAGVAIRNCIDHNLPLTMTLSPDIGAEFIQPQSGRTVRQTISGSGLVTALLRAGNLPGVITITASATGMAPQTATLWLTPDQPAMQILVDDFEPLLRPGESPECCNRLGGRRGVVGDTKPTLASGWLTTVITAGDWGGGWLNLAHAPADNEAVNFAAILPEAILPHYQSQVTHLSLAIVAGTPGRDLHIELKNGPAVLWEETVVLAGGPQKLTFPLTPLGDVSHLTWFLQPASPADYVVLDRIELTATSPITDIAEAGFVWSYGMLLDSWDPATGLVRDKARLASGSFDAIQSTGSLAAATVMAEQLGIIDRPTAVQIVQTISQTLLTGVPRYHGLLPHFVTVNSSQTITIADGTEWSSIDTVIAALSLLDAQHALDLDTSGSQQLLEQIDWPDLTLPGGISHGYTYTGARLSNYWGSFGGESWLVDLAYAAALDQLPPLTHTLPPTDNGSGFIDEIAWLLIRPPQGPDVWGNDWTAYRLGAAKAQQEYYLQNFPAGCFDQLGLFGLSAAEVPEPAAVAVTQTYQAFGVGGRSPAFDGSSLLGAPVVTPHYAPMIASLQPTQVITMWSWLREQDLYTPLNNVESLMFPGHQPACDQPVWNHLKGTWNIALQTLGWGHYLLQRDGIDPAIWQATTENPFLFTGYGLLVPGALPTLDIIDVGVREGHVGLTQFDITVTLSASSSLPVTATYRTIDGTATAAGDYLTKTGQLNIPAGAIATSLTLSVVGDLRLEFDENYHLSITEISRANPGRVVAEITIINDDFIYTPQILK